MGTYHTRKARFLFWPSNHLYTNVHDTRYRLLAMQSLRTRRPSDGKNLSKQPQQTQKLSKTPSRRAGGNARKSRVDDKIKKRMSMRYADISSPTNVSIPALPTIPLELVAFPTVNLVHWSLTLDPP